MMSSPRPRGGAGSRGTSPAAAVHDGTSTSITPIPGISYYQTPVANPRFLVDPDVEAREAGEEALPQSEQAASIMVSCFGTERPFLLSGFPDGTEAFCVAFGVWSTIHEWLAEPMGLV
jgi:hypothetical protein